MPMLKYLIRRVLLMLPTLFGVLLFTFIIIQFVPGGPVEQMMYELKGRGGGEVTAAAPRAGGYQGARGVDAEQLAEIRKMYGFDKPATQRFGEMLWRFARFDLGQSWRHHTAVWSLIVSKLPVSMSIGLSSFFLVYLIGVPLGVAKAVRNGSRFDLISTVAVLVMYAIPSFVLGVLLLVLFGGGSLWQLFPLRGLVSENWDQLSLTGKLLDYLWHLVLPVISMTVGGFATLSILTKNAFLEEIRKQYVMTARAKGLSERKIFWKHILRNALIPLLVGLPEAFLAAFFTGSILIETLFSLDGLGLLSYESILQRDYPVVLGSLYFFTLLGLLGKLVSDLCYALADPRISFDGAPQ